MSFFFPLRERGKRNKQKTARNRLPKAVRPPHSLVMTKAKDSWISWIIHEACSSSSHRHSYFSNNSLVFLSALSFAISSEKCDWSLYGSSSSRSGASREGVASTGMINKSLINECSGLSLSLFSPQSNSARKGGVRVAHISEHGEF